MNITGNILFRQKLLPKCCSALTLKRYSFKIVSRVDVTKLPLKNPTVTSIDVPTKLHHKIKLNGPITVAEYMKESLTGSSGGYYLGKDVFGERGDFVTSPEISQLFGETLGVWFVMEWKKLGSPKPLQFVELGPGRGTLLADILRVFWQLDVQEGDVSIHLVEVSPFLQKLQADRLCLTYKSCDNEPYYYEGETVRGTKVYWYKDIKDVPKGFSWIIAHEFFDALPIHKFKKTPEGWREILVDVESEKTDKPDLKFKYVLSRNETTASKLYVPLTSNENMTDLEVSPQSMTIAKELSDRVDEDGGIALIVDYGQDAPPGDTLRAFKQHKQVDPLLHTGSSDLTADVDFSLIKKVAQNAKVFGPITQGKFLQNMHGDARLKVLLEKSSAEDQEILKSGYDMLTEPHQMGERFKFLALFPTINEEHYKKLPVFGFS